MKRRKKVDDPTIRVTVPEAELRARELPHVKFGSRIWPNAAAHEVPQMFKEIPQSELDFIDGATNAQIAMMDELHVALAAGDDGHVIEIARKLDALEQQIAAGPARAA